MNAAVQPKPSRKIWPTPGGVHPPDNKVQSMQLPLETLLAPPFVVLPLNQHIGAKAEPVVSVGDTVLKGQLIASAKGHISANVHASISGAVTAIEQRPVAHPSGMEDTCIIIDNRYQDTDNRDSWYEIIPCANYRQLHPVEIVDRIRAAGVVGMGGAGFPAAVKLQSNQPITTLIVNATECEPYITADDSLMRNESGNILEAIALLDYLLEQPREILIAIEDNKPEAIDIMSAAVKKFGNQRIEVVVLPTKYPSGGEKQLIQMLTGKEVANGQLPSQQGIICQNIATMLAAYYAVVMGKPLISRVVTVSGDALRKQQNLYIPLGTPIDFVLRQQGLQREKLSRLVMGGPMMGFTITDPNVPVVKTTNCILALSHEESPPPSPPMPCIRCGMCAEACPASLLPQQLYWYARAQDHDKLNAYHLFDCIECGACSYSCPSNIPLVQYYRAAKAEIRHAHIEKQHSDRARQRFEFHKQRIESEKLARTEARKLAAEKAKQRQKEKPVSPSATEGNSDAAKIERNLAAAEDRLSKLREKLQIMEQEAPEQVPALQARIKEAEFKYETLSRKLDNNPKAADEAENPNDRTQLANNAPLQQLHDQLAETRKQLSQVKPEEADRITALKLAEKVLQGKIDKAKSEGTAPVSIPIKLSRKDSDNPVQRAMEIAMTTSGKKLHHLDEDPE